MSIVLTLCVRLAFSKHDLERSRSLLTFNFRLSLTARRNFDHLALLALNVTHAVPSDELREPIAERLAVDLHQIKQRRRQNRVEAAPADIRVKIWQRVERTQLALHPRRPIFRLATLESVKARLRRVGGTGVFGDAGLRESLCRCRIQA